MALTSNQKLTVVKAFARANGIPLDPSTVYETKAAAEAYAASDPTAHENQIICVTENGVPRIYALKKETTGFSLVAAGMTGSEAYEAAAPEWGVIVGSATPDDTGANNGGATAGEDMGSSEPGLSS